MIVTNSLVRMNGVLSRFLRDSSGGSACVDWNGCIAASDHPAPRHAHSDELRDMPQEVPEVNVHELAGLGQHDVVVVPVRNPEDVRRDTVPEKTRVLP